MKFYYILANQFVSILLSSNTVTTLHFNTGKIAYCDRGLPTKALEVVYRRQRTSISLVPRTERINSNMTCYMEGGKIYVFNLSWSDKPFHKNIVVNDATSLKAGSLIYESKDFKIFDAGTNYFMENKKEIPIVVNEMAIKKMGVVSKWEPIVIDGKPLFMRGKGE